MRLLADDELPAASHLVSSTMLGSVAEDVTRAWAELFLGQTTHGAFAGDRLVGVARWFPTEVSFAGPSLPAAGVTAVAVAPTHRRQGHLRRMMEAQLASIAAADVPIALLIAAEWPIYGRYGYGSAIDACGYEIDTTSARFTAERTGTIEQVSRTELRPHLEAVHDLRWARTMGAITRTAQVWDHRSGVVPWPGDKADPGQARGAIWRDASGAVQGAVAYQVDDQWTRNRPAGTIDVSMLVGATPEAERELWRHLCETDWITTVKAGTRSVEDPLPLWLEDGRAAVQLDRSDCIWARILDVPRVLGRRRSPIPGHVVIEVDDDLGYGTGRWQVQLGPDEASVQETTAPPDARLSIGTLGAALFGGTSVARLHDAGAVVEAAPGGVTRLDALLRTPAAPWCPTTF